MFPNARWNNTVIFSSWMIIQRVDQLVKWLLKLNELYITIVACAVSVQVAQWVSYQIRKIAVCAWAENAGNGFPTTTGLTIPTCITARASRTCHGACRDCRWRGKGFPALPAHAHPAILRIWQEAHGNFCFHKGRTCCFLLSAWQHFQMKKINLSS